MQVEKLMSKPTLILTVFREVFVRQRRANFIKVSYTCIYNIHPLFQDTRRGEEKKKHKSTNFKNFKFNLIYFINDIKIFVYSSLQKKTMTNKN